MTDGSCTFRVALLILAALFVLGCTPEQRRQWEDFDPLNLDRTAAEATGEGAVEALPRVTDNPTEDDGDPTWLPEPVGVKVYPSTRFGMAEGQIVLEARVELLDAMGDPVKAPGLFSIALEGTQHMGMTPNDRTLYRWQIRVRTLDDQKRHYDPVTQTYLFNLKLRELAAPREAVIIKASFTTRQGKVLDGQLALPGRP